MSEESTQSEIKAEVEAVQLEANEENEEHRENSIEKSRNDDEVRGESEDKVPSYISSAAVQSQFVRLRGLPYNSTDKDVVDFFTGLAIERIKFVSMLGRPSGEAYVEFKSKEDAAHAMEFDRKEIKSRYIEVFSVATSEAEFAWRSDDSNSGMGGQGDDNHVVRLRGIPWSCKEDDIRQFFEGLEPAPAEIVIGGTGGPRSRPSGEAFVRFATADGAQKAMEYNKRHMGSRYVEVFQSSMIELNREKGFAGGGGGGGSYERTGIRPLMSLDRSDSGYNGGGGAYGGGGYGGYEDHHQHRGGGGYGGGQQDYGGYGGYDQGGYGAGGDVYGGGGVAEPFRIYMRGLPYDADAHAVESFFTPIRCHSVKFGINESGRPSGDAIAEFDTYNDMASGMTRNNQRMGRRYVELFYTRDAPGPMKRLLWKDASGSMSSAPAPDPVLSGRRGGGPPMGGGRDSGYGGGRAPRGDQWSSGPPRRGGYDAPPGGVRAAGRRPPDAWGGAAYSSGAASGYDQPQSAAHSGYGAAASGWDGYGYGGGGGGSAVASGYGYGGGGVGSGDRQRESRDAAWGPPQQNAYGGWGQGHDQRGGY